MPEITSTPALRIRVQRASHDRVIADLWAAETTGIEELADDLLRAHFTAPPPAELTRRLLGAGAIAVTLETIPGRDWVGLSRRRTRARRIGRLLVRPPWSRARPRPGELELVIDPARAFGTGGHESTRLILRIIPELELAGHTVLDIGAGSGILALAALRFGARRAFAIDIDAEATSAVRINAGANRLADRIAVARCGPDSIGAAFTAVLANLTRPLLAQLGGSILACVRPAGELVVAGFLARDVGSVTACFAPPLVPVGRLTEGEWTALRFRRG